MPIDAIVLTGGRSSRLGSLPKSEFTVDDSTLLERTIAALEGIRRIVVVGPEPCRPLPDAVLLTRETPTFAGPVAGIATGVAALAQASATMSEHTVVLACDMPHVARAVPVLLRELRRHRDSDGVIAVDSGKRRQPLAAAYRTGSLAAVLARRAAEGSLDAMPVFRLIEPLALMPVDVPLESTTDVDTWDDAARLGARAPQHPPEPLHSAEPLRTPAPLRTPEPMYSTAQEGASHE